MLPKAFLRAGAACLTSAPGTQYQLQVRICHVATCYTQRGRWIRQGYFTSYATPQGYGIASVRFNLR